MGDEIEAVTETAKAVQEVAKTGRALIEPGTDLANYVATMLGTVPEDVVGFLVGDPLHELRQRGLLNIIRAAFEKLHKRGVERVRPLRPEPGKEALEAASLENDETLQEMWANLIANAMDPNKREISLQRLFIQTLKQLEPIDALVLKQLGPTVAGAEVPKLQSHEISRALEIRQTLIAISVTRLQDLKCLKQDIGNRCRLTDIGWELCLACRPDAADRS